MITRKDNETRGEFLRNPGNIRHSSVDWQGMAAEQTDPDFVTFDQVCYGIRALAKVLLAYQLVHKLRTVRQIINRWAPPNENDTGSYVGHVAHCLGVDPDEDISLLNPFTLEKLVTAIIVHENGRCAYDGSTISQGVAMAIPTVQTV